MRDGVHTRANQEAVEMLLGQPACGRTSETSCKALGAISGLNLHTE